ncbi:uncharacterized protein ACA1_378910 [Acanthamoeba castellanii str. Neff]|uniref:GATA-type domain-containing protein n=1 Tax=Acanthamoeba castellanii (strain ATCC 30010 / Neff) TaxID=1257118 RepID=L8GRW3_ACACF|nr:uncharacterized protein ACA1_378910 [Acanthamoeba castellanii str. Neff]ELR15720.1 hypothetical protein ACA1_378910 [Acanthamoeba castellanii str. Neff]
MDRCAALLRIETQEYHRALVSASSTTRSTIISSSSEAPRTVEHNAQELYVAMVQLANHLQQVTHDLLHHHQRHRRLGRATTSCSAALAPAKKIEKKKKKTSSARSCEHCGRTSSAAWRRGPDYRLCGLRYQAWKNTIRSMSVQAILN